MKTDSNASEATATALTLPSLAIKLTPVIIDQTRLTFLL